jgi:hypothetical protein
MWKSPVFFGAQWGKAIPTIATSNIFFDAAEWPRARGGARGMMFPTIAASNIFFDAAEWPRARGGAREKVFPTIATPEGPPIMLGYRWDPPITPYRLFIHIWNTR